MSIWSSINCPTVICLPAVCYFFSREATSETYDHRSLSHIICLCDLFLFAFIFRFINPKTQKYLAVFYFYLFCLAFDLSIYYNFLTSVLPILRCRTPEGIDNPFNTSGCEDLFFVCMCCLCCVAWFSYWFDNLDFISEGNTYRLVLHHPFLFGEIPT